MPPTSRAKIVTPPKRSPVRKRAHGAARSTGSNGLEVLAKTQRAEQPASRDDAQPSSADPRKDAHYIDNIIDRVECALVAADRYTLRWSGGHMVVPNADIDWTGASKALPVLDVQDDLGAARSRAAKWSDVAISTGYERTVAFYRGGGGAILPTWFSPETAPATYELIRGVNRKVREEAQRAAQLFRGMRDGMVVGFILGGLLRLGVHWSGRSGSTPEPSPRGGGGGDPPIDPTPPRPPVPTQTEPLTTPAPRTEGVEPTATAKVPEGESLISEKDWLLGDNPTGPEAFTQTSRFPGTQADKVKHFQRLVRELRQRTGWNAELVGTASDGSAVFKGDQQKKALVITLDGRVLTGTWGKHVNLRISVEGVSLTCDWNLPGWHTW